MNILLLSSGGGGGNILRSLKTLFARDVAVAQQTDAIYANRLRDALTTRFLDTNEFSLAQVPKEERILIGASTTRRLGSRHSPELARRALDESRSDVERLIAQHAVVVTIGTGGKGTGAGTMFPIAEMARRQNKLILPVFVRPSFERHEVDKRRYDHALHVAEQFDAAGIRLIEILNDRAYSDSDPQPQSVVWERMNLPIARGLRGLLYVLWDLSQVDPSDLSILLAGPGRMRIGFAEVRTADDEEPSDAEIGEAVRGCWHNPYCVFSKPVGTSLVCIQGDWSNLADAKIKSGSPRSRSVTLAGGLYNPLYARAFHTPKPWGVTALFTEYTGVHEPLALDWTVEELGATGAMGAAGAVRAAGAVGATGELGVAGAMGAIGAIGAVGAAGAMGAAAGALGAAGAMGAAAGAMGATGATSVVAAVSPVDRRGTEGAEPFETLWDFARAVNRSDRVAVELAAGAPPAGMMVDGPAVKKLLGTFWFRAVFPHLSDSWRERLLDALGESLDIPNHVMRVGRQAVGLKKLTFDQMRDISTKTLVRGPAGTDLQLLIAIGSLWGEEAFTRVRFVEIAQQEDQSRLAALLGLRS